MENSFSNLHISDNSGFLDIIPVEIIEHVMSFCGSKDLLTLARTCVTFKDLLIRNVKLMSKFCFSMNFRLMKNELFFARCLKNRHFTSLKIENLRSINQLTPLLHEFRKIEELRMEKCKLAPKDFETLIRSMPRLKKCFIDTMFSLRYVNPQNPLPPQKEGIPIDSLVELSIHNSDHTMSYVFSACHNLKVLSIDGHTFFNLAHFALWQLVNLKLKKLQIFDGDFENRIEKTFVDFLKRQTDLEEFTCKLSKNIIEQIFATILQLPMLKHINIASSCPSDGNRWCCKARVPQCRVVIMNSIPHELLGKFRFLTKYFDKDPSKIVFHWIYSPDVPDDMNAFERDVMAFLDSDCDIPGNKHCQRIESATVGNQSWLDAGFVLKKTFIANLIAKLPKLTQIKLYGAANEEETMDVIKESGRSFKAVQMISKSGNYCFVDDGSLDGHVSDDSDDSDSDHFDISD